MTVEWKGSNGREFYLDNQIKKNKWSIGAEVGVRFGRTLFYLLDNNPRLQMYASLPTTSHAAFDEAFKNAGVPYISLTNYASLIELAVEKGDIDPNTQELLMQWRNSPSTWGI